MVSTDPNLPDQLPDRRQTAPYSQVPEPGQRPDRTLAAAPHAFGASCSFPKRGVNAEGGGISLYRLVAQRCIWGHRRCILTWGMSGTITLFSLPPPQLLPLPSPPSYYL